MKLSSALSRLFRKRIRQRLRILLLAGPANRALLQRIGKALAKDLRIIFQIPINRCKSLSLKRPWATAARSAPTKPANRIRTPNHRTIGLFLLRAPVSYRISMPFLTDSYVFDWGAHSFRADIIFVLPIAICLGLGIALGHPGAGMIAAGGAFTVGFGAKQHIDESHILPMILARWAFGSSPSSGMVAGHTNFILVLLAAGAAFVYGMLSLREPASAG